MTLGMLSLMFFSVSEILSDKIFASKRHLLKFVYGADSRLTDYTEWQNLRRAHARQKSTRDIGLSAGSTPIQMGDFQGDSCLRVPTHFF